MANVLMIVVVVFHMQILMAHAMLRDVWCFSPLMKIFHYLEKLLTISDQCIFVSIPYIGNVFCKHYNAYVTGYRKIELNAATTTID